MFFLEIVLIAVGLAMDAFAVSITLGLSVTKPKVKELIIPGIYFGAFQALMPAIGYFVGTYFVHAIQKLDHWIAFALLGFIGGKMIKESFSKEKNKEKPAEYMFGFTKMLVLAIATSIDALVVGITFAFFEVNIFKAILITGMITFIISISGVKIGNIFGTKFKSKAEFIGGAVLILIGIKILIEHIWPNG
ncbi:MAG: manganese efflux pump MntP family protein [Spirochaetaceae bacterium]|jgi:putative Mn2+ efflux pump MntP|nr:manganese efflux pump MntP family protein [Spirochaetaceae bacterium]